MREKESCLQSGEPEVVLYPGAQAVLWVGSCVAPCVCECVGGTHFIPDTC